MVVQLAGAGIPGFYVNPDAYINHILTQAKGVDTVERPILDPSRLERLPDKYRPIPRSFAARLYSAPEFPTPHLSVRPPSLFEGLGFNIENIYRYAQGETDTATASQIEQQMVQNSDLREFVDNVTRFLTHAKLRKAVHDFFGNRSSSETVRVLFTPSIKSSEFSDQVLLYLLFTHIFTADAINKPGLNTIEDISSFLGDIKARFMAWIENNKYLDFNHEPVVTGQQFIDFLVSVKPIIESLSDNLPTDLILEFLEGQAHDLVIGRFENILRTNPLVTLRILLEAEIMLSNAQVQGDA